MGLLGHYFGLYLTAEGQKVLEIIRFVRFRQRRCSLNKSHEKILEQAPQGMGGAKPVRIRSNLTQIHPNLPKSNLTNQNLDPLNVDLMPDLVNPCAIG